MRRPRAPRAAPEVSAAFGAILADHAGDPDVSLARMLHAPALKVRGKVFAFETKDVLVLKLPEGRVDVLVAAGDAARFGPRPDRPMREWVGIGASRRAEWSSLAAEAKAFVAGP